MGILPNLATEKNRWFALIVLALGLGIVIIDNTVLNVAVPYILRDLNSSFDSIQWVISGYALIIATLLITVGRLGDLIGRKKIFLLGTVLFAIGSFIASISQNVLTLFLGEAFIEAVGAAMMMTSSLSLLVSGFQGKERSIAFGVWGSVAGAAASLGPLLGGYLTTYYSWRWSLRINVVVALIAIIGSVFIREAKGNDQGKRFDWWGTMYSGAGLFFLIFSFIEGRKFGWLEVNEPFSFFGITWSFFNISIIPITFILAILFLIKFTITEYFVEKSGGSPLLKLEMFKNRSFSMGLITLGIISLGQFGIFFILPIYLQNVLNMTALQTGITFLPATICAAIFGPLSGFVASKIGPKPLATVGMFVLAIGAFILSTVLRPSISGWDLVFPLLIFGVGIGMASAQLTNVILSGIPMHLAGEASAANATIRQVGTSIGIAVIGVVLAGTLTANINNYIMKDPTLPDPVKSAAASKLQNISIEQGAIVKTERFVNESLDKPIKDDINNAFTDSARSAMRTALVFIVLGAFTSLLIPSLKPTTMEEMSSRIK